ncbi:MAG: DNA polymerase IV [Thermoplasmata archaeon]|nr:DNA polymerase IV [Thermoplasmata archaeon]
MRWTIYIDLDAFYVSCERRGHPELEARPVIVGPEPRDEASRGVVLSASYEARSSGVRSAMPVVRARNLCPEATWIRPDFEKYEQAAAEVRAFLAKRFERVAAHSIDEASILVDLGTREDAEQVARTLQADVTSELHLPCSVGVAPNRTIAKIATDRAKPGGVLVVPPEEVVAFLSPLPVRTVPGIGPKTEDLLRSVGVTHVGELRSLPPGVRKQLGRFAEELHQLASGEILPDPEDVPMGPRSRSTDHTFEQDLSDPLAVAATVDELADELARALAIEGRRYRTVTVGVRWADFQRVQRSRTLPSLQEGAEALAGSARRLFEEIWSAEVRGLGRRVRTVSVGAERLVAAADRQARLEQYDAGGAGFGILSDSPGRPGGSV